MDGTEIKERLRSTLGQAILAVEKKAKKEFSKEDKDPWQLTEEKITDNLAKNASEKVFEGMKKSDRTTKIIRAILKKKYLATCIAQRFENIRGHADKKEKGLYDAYAQDCKNYIELITKMLENRALEANTGYDRKMAEYRQLESRRKLLDKELERLEKSIILEDALKETEGFRKLEDLLLDQKYN